MAPHIKIGQGFKIIYGGRSKIQWIFDSKVGEQTTQPSYPILPTNHPAVPFLDGLNTAVQFLQWWEQRRQNNLSYAQFEERRIPWLIDMMNTFYEEFKSGELRHDTTIFFESEITKLFNKIEENDLVDVPSSLLLQISRTTDLFVEINKLVSKQFFKSAPNFILPGSNVPQPFVYKSCHELKDNDLENYLLSIDELKKGLGLGLPILLMASPVMSGLLWGYHELLKVRDKQKKRMDSFVCLRNLAIELRSTSSILLITSTLPQSVWYITQEEIDLGKEGKPLLIENGEFLAIEK